MVDKVKIELDKQFLDKFFALTDRVIPENQEITILMLNNQLNEVEDTLKESNEKIEELQQQLKENDKKKHSLATPLPPVDSGFPSEEIVEGAPPRGSILIIDDLGVITYQLAVLFKKMNYEVVTSREIYDAVSKFKNQNFDIVIMDLFIPTEREGFILLDEIKKCSNQKGTKTFIGVMSASSKKEHKQICKAKGAEFYMEKVDDWQKVLCSLISNYNAEKE